MKTRARAWTIRAAVVAVVTAASIVGVTTPAHASPIIINFILSTNTISAGQTVTATWSVRSDQEEEVVNVSVQANNQSVQCTSGDCNVVGAEISQDGRDFEAVFSTSGTITNEQHVQIRVRAGNVESPPQPLTVRPAPQVPEVRGTVTDVNTGEPVSGARVSMTDSAGTKWDNIGTDENGVFQIVSTEQKPIVPGEVRFTVQKDGIQDYTSGTFMAVADQILNVPLKVVVLNPSASATTSLPPITATDLATGTPVDTTSVAAPADSGLSGFSIMLIVLGGLLVVVGIAAIVFLFIRRNDEDGDGPPRGGPPGMGGRVGPPGAPGRGGPPGPRRPGPPDRTMPMRPGYGPPRPGAPGTRDQTMIARSPLADAPTQLHGRPGAPQPPYSGPPAHPNQQPPGGYPPAGYGPQQPGYGAAPAGPPAGYPQQPGYGGGQPGYSPPRPSPGGYDDPRHAARPTSEGRRVDWMDD